MKINKLTAILFLITLIILSPQNSTCVAKRSGRPVISISEKLITFQNNLGNHYSKAVTQNTQYYPKNTQITEFTHNTPTLDKKFVSLKIQTFWRISDPEKYQKNIRNYNMAKNRVWDLTEEAVRRVIIGHNLKDIVIHTEIGILENERCSRDIEIKILELSNTNLSKIGLKIVNIEARVNYPL